jgi:hypothetical protein
VRSSRCLSQGRRPVPGVAFLPTILTATVTATGPENCRIPADAGGLNNVISNTETTLCGPPRTG